MSAVDLAELADAVFPYDCEARGIAVLVGYFDESGTDGQHDVTIISGFIAPLANWIEFQQGWKRQLAKWDVDWFHYVTARNCSKQYQGWNYREQSIPHINDMAQELCRHRLAAFTVGYRGDYDKMMLRFPEWHPRFPTAYSLCFEMLINLFRSYNVELGNEKLQLIMASTEAFQGRAYEVFHHYKNAGLWPEIVGLNYATSADVAALQAADMLAYETRRFAWKRDIEYWREQPFLSRWLPLCESGERIIFESAYEDPELAEFLSQEKGQYLQTPPTLDGR